MKPAYKVQVTPSFINDMREIVSYITVELKNPQAAQKLADDVQSAIVMRAQCPADFEPLHTKHVFPNPYYTIHVRNYMIFYVLLDDTMEIRRVMYQRRNWIELL